MAHAGNKTIFAMGVCFFSQYPKKRFASHETSPLDATVAGQTLLSNGRRHKKAPVGVKYWRLGTGKQNPIER
jgi:hypothetical protein